MSATLKAGKLSGSWTKSVTPPPRARSMTLPIAPPMSIPVGSQNSGRRTCVAKYTSSSASARATTSVTTAPPPDSAPNATPVLRVWTIATPGTTAIRSPSSTVARTSAFVAWSSAMTPAATTATRPHAPSRTALSLDESGDDAGDDPQQDDRDDRAQIERPERRDEPPEDRDVRLAHVAQEPEHRARPARVRHPPAEREEHRAEDVGDDQEDVDVRERHDVARDGVAQRGEHEPARGDHPVLRIASIASENAARRPPRSSASSPRAVEPPGDVTPRRTASVSYSRRRMSSAVPAIVCTTSSDAWRAGMPRRTPASTCASATSA